MLIVKFVGKKLGHVDKLSGVEISMRASLWWTKLQNVQLVIQ